MDLLLAEKTACSKRWKSWQPEQIALGLVEAIALGGQPSRFLRSEKTRYRLAIGRLFPSRISGCRF
jgi:hypothetical protein